MNFLSHYIYDHQAGNAAYNAGLVLPDLLRNSGIRLKNYHWQLETDDPALPLSLGVAQHHARDASWHNSFFFIESQRQLREAVIKRGVDPDQVRLFFLEHILVELLLDRQWVKLKPEMTTAFYQDLAYLKTDTCLRALAAQELDNLERFRRFMERFLEAQYLFQYAFNEQFFYSLSRIYQRVGLLLEPETEKPLMEAMLELEEVWRKSVNLEQLSWK